MAQTVMNLTQEKKIANAMFKEYCKLLRNKYTPNNKILFIQVPQLILKSFNPEIAKKRGYYAFAPTGLQYLYGALKNRNLEIRILDLNFLILKRVNEDEAFDHLQWMEILENYLQDFQSFIIGVSCMFDLSIPILLQILEFLKKRDASVVITGGVIPAYEWKNLFLRDLCHFVVRGEGENKINYLFDNLTGEEQNTIPTPGICFKYNGEYLETEGKIDTVELISDLRDSYPLVNIGEYYKYGSLNPFSRIAGIYDTPFAPIQLSRGCRGICTFCSVGDFMGKGVRKRPIEKVLSEMEFLINKYGVRHFEWLDDDLLFFKSDFELLLQEIINRNWKITWSANNGLIAKSIDDKLMRLMRDSGCIGFKIGIETGNAEMLKKIKKPANLDTFRRVAQICSRYPEVFVGGNFMLGFPDEKFSQMLDSFKFYLELNLDWGAFTTCQVIRGATAFSDCEDHFDSQIGLNDKNIRNFIPMRESSQGWVSTTRDNILKGLDIFKIEPDSIPDKEEIKEIWFTFNLIGNYINNKNLRPEGRVEKFISWVEMAQVGYPTNGYMCLFLSFAYMIKGDKTKSKENHDKVIGCLKSDYWRERFVSFGLNNVLNNFPKIKSEVFDILEDLQKYTSNYY